jgi:phosphotransferase system enzyme I (PtsI)
MSDSSTVRMQGIAGSPGVIVGRALVVDRRRVAIPRRHLDATDVDTEIQRLRTAIEAARTQLQGIRARIPAEAAEHALILDAHLLMLDDQLLIEQCEQSIREEQVNAEWALRRTVEKIKELFDRADDDYFRERRTDVDFVGERVLRHLMGAPQDILRPREADGPVILVAHELSPADTAALARSAVVGFVTDVGSSTSHTAIMARALSLPAVVGAADATRNIATGDLIIVDGLRGEVLLRPGAPDVLNAEERGRRYAAFVRALGSNRDAAAMTHCGKRVQLRANIELPAEAAVAMDHGADGIGLYRTEFLYVDRREPPAEDEQYEVYRKIVETVAPKIVTLRTFDIGGDKFSSAFRLPREMNPALGLRAVRLALRERDVFRTQLRAMLRAANHGNVRIMIPMISAVFELRESKAEIALAKKELKERGIEVPDVPIGIMVETPSAVLCADLLALESAFFSIGTNDLIQYSLAIDRGNEHVAHLSRPFDPSIIRSLAMIANAARVRGIPCALCGAMAGNILAVPALLGLGIGELSVEPAAVPEIKAAIARTDLEEARSVMAKALLMSTADEVEGLLRDAYGERFDDLLTGGEEAVVSDTGTFLLKDIKAPQVGGGG